MASFGFSIEFFAVKYVLADDDRIRYENAFLTSVRPEPTRPADRALDLSAV
jgi:hypothetical protein